MFNQLIRQIYKFYLWRTVTLAGLGPGGLDSAKAQVAVRDSDVAARLAMRVEKMLVAVVVTALLIFIMGYGISLEVETLPAAVPDTDQTITSPQYAQSIAGAPRYFVEQPLFKNYARIDHRMLSGELTCLTRGRDRPGMGGLEWTKLAET